MRFGMALQPCDSWLLLWRPLETAVQAISWKCSPIENKVSLSLLIFSYLSLVISVYTVVRYSFIKANLLAISSKVNNPQEAVHLNFIQRGCLAGIMCASVQGGINATFCMGEMLCLPLMFLKLYKPGFGHVLLQHYLMGSAAVWWPNKWHLKC